MAFDYINEAFKKLDLLEEQMFDTSLDGINKLADFMENDDTEEVIRVIDPEASSDEDIQDSYVGKVIVNCNVCHSHIFENKEDIKIETDGSVNIDVQCPYCGEQEGFTIVGEIAPYGESTEDSAENKTTEVSDDSNPVEETETEEEEKDNLDEALGLGAGLALGGAAIGAGMIGSKLLDSYEPEEEKDRNISPRMSRATRRLQKDDNVLSEDFKEVSITTEDQKLEMTSDENGKVTVTTEPVTDDASSGDMIVPVSDETETEILDNNAEVIEEQPPEEDQLGTDTEGEESTDSGESLDLDFDEVDEEGMDELGESYLRKVYENVKSFKTTDFSANDHALIVEGVITFNSGAQKKTGFLFEAQDVNTRGQLRFRGNNKHFAESMDAFSLVGRIDNKKLFVESLKYNYKVNEESVRGLVRRK